MDTLSFTPSLPKDPEKAHGIRQGISEALAPRHLGLMILPTEKCNFRCTYCYEDFAVGKMSSETVAAVKKLIGFRMGDLRHLELSWFGGEPLAAADVVEDISAYANEACALAGVELLPGGITTNGSLLNKPLLKRLIELKQKSFQISLDGWKEGHDATRRTGQGLGTFDGIWRNLLMMRDADLDFGVMLRIHITDTNRDSLLRLGDEILREFGADRRFTIYLKPIENLGGPNAAQIRPLPKAERDRLMRELRELFQPMDRRSHDDLRASAYICYASKPNHLIIRANGKLAKCSVAFDDPKNDIGQLRPDGTLLVNQAKLPFWFRGLHSKDADDLACPIESYLHSPAFDKKVIPLVAA